MATFTTTASNWTNATNDDNFRAWGSYISSRFAAVGLIQTSDTGQVNWTTAANPGATNTYPHYEVWRFNDALQATAPVFFKIFYGEGSGTDTPAIGISFGTGSDGSGNLTGTTSTLMRTTSAAGAGSTTVVGSGSTNRFSFNNNTGSSAGMLFGFERTKDSVGNDTSEGIVYFANGSTNFGNVGSTATSARTLYWNPNTGTVVESAASSSLAALFPWQSSFVFGAQTGIAPVFAERPLFTNPILNVVGYYTGDITPTNTFMAYMYGTAHQYYACAAAASISSSGWRGAGGGTEAAAILYE